VYAWLSRHPRLVDGVPAFWLAIIGVPSARFSGIWLLPVIAGLVIPVIFRRKYPVQAFAVAAGAGALQLIVFPSPIGSDLAILLLLYTLAAYRPRRLSIAGLAVCLIGAVTAVGAWAPHVVGAVDRILLATVVFSGTALVAWVLGDSMRYRRAYLTSLEDRAARLERERDAQAQIATAAERARIARELHDVIAHNVSVMVVQATAPAMRCAGTRNEPARRWPRSRGPGGRPWPRCAACSVCCAPMTREPAWPRSPASTSFASCSTRRGRRACRSRSPWKARPGRSRRGPSSPPTAWCRSR